MFRLTLAATTAALALSSVTAQTAQNAPGTVPAQSNGPGGAPRSFADLTARLAPAVVNVSTTQKVEVSRTGGGLEGTPFAELFRRFQEQQGDDGQPVTREAMSLGSGFIISPDGYVVTNNHVISGRDGASPVETITVTLADRREFKARLIGRDVLSDIAVLKIDGAGLPFVRFGNSQTARVGDWVIAIGNPFGLGGTVTAGIISALHRNIQGSGAYDRYIQTDASINQGNSGGPLFDLDGNVVGINNLIFAPGGGGNVGLGFAIPSELAAPVVAQLRTGGKVKRGYLGVQIQPLSEGIASSLGLPKDRGEIVANVEKAGPAERAGIRQGDVIVRVAGQVVTVDNTLSFIVANEPIGSRVPVEVLRGGQRVTLQAVIAERPAEQALASATAGEENEASPQKAPGERETRASLGITVQAITPETRTALRLPETVRGVVIGGVNPSSDAATSGLQRGDVILSINQRPTLTPQDAAAAVTAAKAARRDSVLLLVQRGANPPAYFGVKLLGAK